MPPLQDPEETEMERFWAEMATQKHKVTDLFLRLATIAKMVLVLTNSNADAERVCSGVGLNKTETSNSLALDGPVINNDNKDGALLHVGALPCNHQGLKEGHKPVQQGTQI